MTEALSIELETFLEQAKSLGPGVYVRLRKTCMEWDWDGRPAPDPITTVARLRALFEESEAKFLRTPNFGHKTLEHLRHLLNGGGGGQSKRAQEPNPIVLNADSECPWCHVKHDGRCPVISSLEYFESGAVRRVEFFGDEKTIEANKKGDDL